MYTIKFLDGTEKEFENLIGANLEGANLREADLRGANLIKANLREADLRGANLYRANLNEADLRGANLYRANLYRANLNEADLNEADLNGADLRGANLNGANLEQAKGIISFTGGRHSAFAYMHDNRFRVKIGCKDFDLEFWLDNIDIIGNENGYEELQISRYLNFIEGVKKYGL